MDNMIYKEEFQDRLYYVGNDQHGRQIAMEHEFSKHISKKYNTLYWSDIKIIAKTVLCL